jgi:hypothetical protein
MLPAGQQGCPPGARRPLPGKVRRHRAGGMSSKALVESQRRQDARTGSCWAGSCWHGRVARLRELSRGNGRFAGPAAQAQPCSVQRAKLATDNPHGSLTSPRTLQGSRAAQYLQFPQQQLTASTVSPGMMPPRPRRVASSPAVAAAPPGVTLCSRAPALTPSF